MKYLIGGGFIMIAILMVIPRQPCEVKTDYKGGEVAIFNDTQEKVRIVSEWRGSHRCNKTGKYTIRFSDGGEINVIWKALTKHE